MTVEDTAAKASASIRERFRFSPGTKLNGTWDRTLHGAVETGSEQSGSSQENASRFAKGTTPDGTWHKKPVQSDLIVQFGDLKATSK